MLAYRKFNLNVVEADNSDRLRLISDWPSPARQVNDYKGCLLCSKSQSKDIFAASCRAPVPQCL